VPVNQYINGMDVNPEHTEVALVTYSVGETVPSTYKLSHPSYPNAAPDKDNEIRFYELDASGVLTYDGSWDLGADGINVRWSPDGKKLALTAAPGNINGFISSGGIYFGSNYVTVFDITGNHASPGNVLGASPLAFGLSFSPDSSKLVYVGQDTPSWNGATLANVVSS